MCWSAEGARTAQWKHADEHISQSHAGAASGWSVCASACRCLVPLFWFQIALVRTGQPLLLTLRPLLVTAPRQAASESQLRNKTARVCVEGGGDTGDSHVKGNGERLRRCQSTSESTSLLAWDLRSNVNICLRGGGICLHSDV